MSTEERARAMAAATTCAVCGGPAIDKQGRHRLMIDNATQQITALCQPCWEAQHEPTRGYGTDN